MFETAANDVGKLYSLPVDHLIDPQPVAVARAGGAVADVPAGGAPTDEAKGDKALPDPTRAARIVGAAFALTGVVAAIVLNVLGLTAQAFDPARIQAANFALFAGFYVAALIVERVAEFVSPYVPPWAPPAQAPDGLALDADARTAHVKADRGMVMLGITYLLAVLLSGLLGLFFMTAIGMNVSHTVDTMLTGLVIAGGTKKLHDFISLLQNRNNPTTGTGAS